MKKSRLLLISLFAIAFLCPPAWSAPQPAWQAPAQKALGQALAELGRPAEKSGLVLLTNAPYGGINGQSCEAFLDDASTSTGCGLGSRNMLLIHTSTTQPLWFALFRKDTGKLIFGKWTGSGFERQSVDARPEFVLTPKGWKQAASGIIGPHMFSVVSISLAWAENPPWPLLMAACFHDHFCPGVNAGYIAGQSVLAKLPPKPGCKYVFANAPAKCWADALQVMFNATPGKAGTYTMAIKGSKLKKYAKNDVAPITVAMRVDYKKNKCDALVLGFDWNKAYGLTGVKADEMAPKGGRKNPMFWIARAKMSRELAKLPPEKQASLVTPLKSISGPAGMAAKITAGDPFGPALKK